MAKKANGPLCPDPPEFKELDAPALLGRLKKKMTIRYVTKLHWCEVVRIPNEDPFFRCASLAHWHIEPESSKLTVIQDFSKNL